MFMLLTALPAALTLWALGGRLSALTAHRWRGLWLVWLALAIQVVLFTPLGNGLADGVIRSVHVASYVPLVAFLVANRGAGLGIDRKSVV